MDRLPSDVLFEILRQLPDLDSLDNVLRASPDAWRCFDWLGVAIIESILDSGCVSDAVRVILCTISFVRQGILPINNLPEFRRRVTDPAIWHGEFPLSFMIDGVLANSLWVGRDEVLEEDRFEDAFVPTKFPRPCSSTMLRTILAIARRVSFLTLGCLQWHQQNFLALQPCVSADPEYDGYGKPFHILLDYVDSTQTPYQVEDIGPVSWREEQLVYRAVWRIQLIKEVNRALSNNTLGDWIDSEMEPLEQLDLVDVYGFERLAMEIALRERFKKLRHSLAHVKKEDLVEHALITTVLNYLDNGQQSLSCPCSWSRPSTAPQRDPRDYLYIQHTHWHSGVMNFNRIFGSLLIGSNDSQRLTYEPYRKLGFSIWSQDRMQAYGLGFHQGKNPWPNYLGWRSILNPEDIEKIERLEAIFRVKYLDQQRPT